MADLMRTAAAHLADVLTNYCGTTVSFVRRGVTGAGATGTLTATVARSAYETQNESGVIERWESRDYIVKTADLTFTPARGDQIREVIAGATGVFEVVTPRGVPLTHPGDAFEATTRIHTIRKS